MSACERIDPESDRLHRGVLLDCAAVILGNRESAEVFRLALDGLLADEPSPAILTQRTHLLVARFTALFPDVGGLS
jgi:hypothetical protein